MAVQLIVMIVFGIACALIANSRGRAAIGWFFIGFLTGCIGLVLVLVLPNVREEEAARQRLLDQNRRLREQQRLTSQTVDRHHAETVARLGVHDRALGIDTNTPQITAGTVAPPPLPAPAPGAADAPSLTTVPWHYAVGGSSHGPAAFADLRTIWHSGGLTPRDLVWTAGMAEWMPVQAIPGLMDALSA